MYLDEDRFAKVAMGVQIEDHLLVIKQRIGQDTAIRAQIFQRLRHRFQNCLRDEVQLRVVGQANQRIYLPGK